eukprot:CAMPEP_0114149188 /NCGR_PEP_ID=MMETSP0043_2-20121206/22023_1 /TAXON_ID=464988 /ORGANISM="Hemiselmis andersenii, Strain CCMP644" /LENGTH=173 /DNA_ID=CAMNT_0001243809 /DNA_START=316 /DNA_END=834 /DNA_ORIENTATION=-
MASPRGESAAEDVVERVDVRLRVEDLRLTEVLCCRAEARQAGALVQLLSTCLSLPHLKYLKRVRRLPAGAGDGAASGQVLVLLGPRDDVEGMAPADREELERLSHEVRPEMVPSFPPNTREQFDAWCSTWPLNFRPPQGGIKTLNSFSPSELSSMRSFMHEALGLASEGHRAG